MSCFKIGVLLLLLCSCTFHNKGNEKQPLDQNQSKGDDEIIKSNELNSPLFDTKNINIEALDVIKRTSEEKDGFTEYTLIYNYEVPLVYKFFIKTDRDNQKKIPENNILLGNRKFFYYDLYNSGRKESEKKRIRPEPVSLYKIKTSNGLNYIAVFAKDMSYNNAYSNELVFLISIDDKAIDALFLDDTYFVNSKFFGDRNNNGYLDFLCPDKNFDTVFCNEITDGKIRLVKNKYLLVDAVDGIGQAFIIKKGSSNW